jgi:hypothetical protein
MVGMVALLPLDCARDLRLSWVPTAESDATLPSCYLVWFDHIVAVACPFFPALHPDIRFDEHGDEVDDHHKSRHLIFCFFRKKSTPIAWPFCQSQTS